MSDPALPDSDRRDAEYLGDGIYAAHDGCQIWLRANDANWYAPTSPRNIHGADIALEPEVIIALVNYAKKIGLLHQLGGKDGNAQ
jgi:hypothetical protein